VRAHRARKTIQVVPDLPLTEVDDTSEAMVESAEEAVRQQIDELGVMGDRPGLCAAALAMARVLDNPKAVPQHPAAAGQLVRTLGELSAGARRGRGRLASVQRMTGGHPGA
jgi:hypothetical protein